MKCLFQASLVVKSQDLVEFRAVVEFLVCSRHMLFLRRKFAVEREFPYCWCRFASDFCWSCQFAEEFRCSIRRA